MCLYFCNLHFTNIKTSISSSIYYLRSLCSKVSRCSLFCADAMLLTALFFKLCSCWTEFSFRRRIRWGSPDASRFLRILHRWNCHRSHRDHHPSRSLPQSSQFEHLWGTTILQLRRLLRFIRLQKSAVLQIATVTARAMDAVTIIRMESSCAAIRSLLFGNQISEVRNQMSDLYFGHL